MFFPTLVNRTKKRHAVGGGWVDGVWVLQPVERHIIQMVIEVCECPMQSFITYQRSTRAQVKTRLREIVERWRATRGASFRISFERTASRHG